MDKQRSRLKTNRVILISGPAGSGKTSLAERIAQNDNWIHVSEDNLWVEIKKGHPVGEGRTIEEQQIIQPAIVKQISTILTKGKNVVLEFINYENPPKPIIYYYKELTRQKIEVLLKVLGPTATVIMERKIIRGRENDNNYEKEIKNAVNQLACLDSSFIQKEWIIDNSCMSIEETYRKYFLEFCQ